MPELGFVFCTLMVLFVFRILDFEQHLVDQENMDQSLVKI